MSQNGLILGLIDKIVCSGDCTHHPPLPSTPSTPVSSIDFHSRVLKTVFPESLRQNISRKKPLLRVLYVKLTSFSYVEVELEYTLAGRVNSHQIKYHLHHGFDWSSYRGLAIDWLCFDSCAACRVLRISDTALEPKSGLSAVCSLPPTAATEVPSS